jgi:hypothetical protein
LNLKIGDLLSHPLSPATCRPCARPFMLMRPIQAHSCMFARVPVHACAPALREHPLLQAICSHAISRVFQEPKTLPEYKHFEPSDPLNPSTEKKIFFCEAPQSRSRPLPRFASMCTPTHSINSLSYPSILASFITCFTCPLTRNGRLAASCLTSSSRRHTHRRHIR